MISYHPLLYETQNRKCWYLAYFHVACDIFVVFFPLFHLPRLRQPLFDHTFSTQSTIIIRLLQLFSLTLFNLSVFAYMFVLICFPFTIFYLFFIHPKFSEQPFPLHCDSPMNFVVFSLISCSSVVIWVVWNSRVEACLLLSNSHSKDKINRTFDQDELVVWDVFFETFNSAYLPPLYRSSRRLSSHWTMRLWCFRGRPRSTVTPTETCCSALWTMSRWVPSSFTTVSPGAGL